MEQKDPLLGLAERVAEQAQRLGIETAVIGAAALAVHGYDRATLDVDLATSVDPGTKLKDLDGALCAIGLHTKLNLPDAEDSLGGVLNVWATKDDDAEPVQVVNFLNPYRLGSSNPGRDAIETATRLEGSSLRCVRLPELIALKLYAGSRNDERDIVELLERNRQVLNVQEIRAACERHGLAEPLTRLMKEAGIELG